MVTLMDVGRFSEKTKYIQIKSRRLSGLVRNVCSLAVSGDLCGEEEQVHGRAELMQSITDSSQH